MDRLGPDDPREPRPQRRRHAHDQGGRPDSRHRPRAAGDGRGRAPRSWQSWTSSPKDGKVSIDELAEALRPVLGPFRLQVGRQAIGRTDALFDQLDRDKDGQLTRPELAAIAGSLRPLDLDDDEMISAYELEPFNSTAVTAVMEHRPSRRGAVRPLSAGRRARRRRVVVSAGPALAQEV